MRILIPIAALLAIQSLAVRAAGADTRRYAVVVAHTEDIERDLPPLEYADDDGARYYELFSRVADQVALYTVLDQDSQRIYPQAAARARPPRRADVLAGIERVFEQAAADVARGDQVAFYLIVVGHGDVGAGGEGYVSLLDAPFTRTDLFQRVLARSTATTNHIIIDACNSYFMVHRRGGDDGAVDDAGPGRRDAVRSFLAREDLGRYPNTGVLLSTSSAKESHEWSAYGAGVFSHQLRSALAGAADVNRDGRIEYSEVEAFVAAANLRIDDPRARVELFARAPAIDLSRPVVSLPETRFRHWLELPAGQGLRMYLEDARGVRYLDAHPSGEQPVVLGLVDSPYYFVRTHDGAREARIELERSGRVTLDPAAFRRSTLAARGALVESFRRHLYAVPYGPGFYRGFVAQASGRPVDERARPWGPPAAAVPDTAAAGPLHAVAAPRASLPGDRRAARVPVLLPGAPHDDRDDGPRRGRRVAAWTLATAGSGLAVAGVTALITARAQRNAFFAAHVDGDGNVVGISPADAERAQARARTWSLAGSLLLAGAGAAGITATVLFTSTGDAARPAGISVAGTF